MSLYVPFLRCSSSLCQKKRSSVPDETAAECCKHMGGLQPLQSRSGAVRTMQYGILAERRMFEVTRTLSPFCVEYSAGLICRKRLIVVRDPSGVIRCFIFVFAQLEMRGCHVIT